jgi:predicted HAD superfamily Cof-like phosphohydrolase
VKRYALNVIDFNKRILRIEERKKGLLSTAELDITKKCLDEESSEFFDAHMNGDFIGAVDALIDDIYFAVGALYKMGLSAEEIEKCADAVHYCNMRKEIGVNERRGDGSASDAVKPEDWIGPEERIAIILGGQI